MSVKGWLTEGLKMQKVARVIMNTIKTLIYRAIKIKEKDRTDSTKDWPWPIGDRYATFKERDAEEYIKLLPKEYETSQPYHENTSPKNISITIPLALQPY